MRRREFIGVLGGAAAMLPLAVRAQQPGKIYRIGFLANDPTIPTQPAGQAFLDGLRESGFVEGKNLAIERRFAEGRLDRYSELAAELVRLGVNVMVTSSTAATLAAKHATTSIPIVMLNVPDPIGEGIVGNLAHPEANVTGFAQGASAEISGKRLQLLKDAIPSAVRIAVLMSPDTSQREERFLELAAQSLHVELSLVSIHQADDIPNAFDELNRTRPDAMFVPNSGLSFTHRKPIVEHAVDSRIPAIFASREPVEIGGLLSYGADRVDVFRRAADFAGKILKGTKPGDLPVEQPTKYELVINLKTAKALNLEIPRSLLLIADEVIE
jgi:putative tryptophan/tyrosine transport system substrate-binding protein